MVIVGFYMSEVSVLSLIEMVFQLAVRILTSVASDSGSFSGERKPLTVEPLQQSDWVLIRQHNQKVLPCAPLSFSYSCVKLTIQVPATVRYLLGAREPYTASNLKLLASQKYERIVIHVGANDICLQQSEVSKKC